MNEDDDEGRRRRNVGGELRMPPIEWLVDLCKDTRELTSADRRSIANTLRDHTAKLESMSR